MSNDHRRLAHCLGKSNPHLLEKRNAIEPLPDMREGRIARQFATRFLFLRHTVTGRATRETLLRICIVLDGRANS